MKYVTETVVVANTMVVKEMPAIFVTSSSLNSLDVHASLRTATLG